MRISEPGGKIGRFILCIFPSFPASYLNYILHWNKLEILWIMSKNNPASPNIRSKNWKYVQFFLWGCKNIRIDIKYLKTTFCYKLLCKRSIYSFPYTKSTGRMPAFRRHFASAFSAQSDYRALFILKHSASAYANGTSRMISDNSMIFSIKIV